MDKIHIDELRFREKFNHAMAKAHEKLANEAQQELLKSVAVQNMTSRTLALQELKHAVGFYDRVQQASMDERIAVGDNHLTRLLAAARTVVGDLSTGCE